MELSLRTILAYWSTDGLSVNIIIFINLFGALLLGLAVGYERSYHGRAAGMRVYGLVCMASAALTVMSGYPNFWFGGLVSNEGVADPTRVVQGIVTGVGFLGAGVIMKEGFNISGLTTAASLWVSASVGVMIGVGFYLSGIMLALMSAFCMTWIAKLESWLPSRHAMAVIVRFRPKYTPNIDDLRIFTKDRGYMLAMGSVWITYDNGKPEWHFVMLAFNKRSGVPIPKLAHDMARLEGVEGFHISHARN